MDKDKNALEDANRISRESRLSVRIGYPEDGVNRNKVGIVSFPETSVLTCDKTVKSGFVCSFDITNDFVTFGKTTSLDVVGPENSVYKFNPVLCEKHLARFRFRLFSVGIHQYSLKCDDDYIYFGEIEVI
jgi:hypothetical protein